MSDMLNGLVETSPLVRTTWTAKAGACRRRAANVGKYAESKIVEDFMRGSQPLGDLVKIGAIPERYPENRRRSRGDASSQWTQLEDFLESRLRMR